MSAVTQNQRLEAVLSKLESVENELRQTKRIMQHILYISDQQGNSETVGTRDRGVQEVQEVVDGLYPGQMPYQPGESPEEIANITKVEKEEEIGTCQS
jgi:hypothetical protein